MRRLLLPALFLSVAAAAIVSADARACGMFVPSIKDREARVPALSIEQVLIIFDEVKSREHFVREIRVDGGDRDFGFVVPLPSKPEIATVGKGLFAKLDEKLPFEAPRRRGGPPGSKGASDEGGVGAGPPPVQVIETKKVGSFTATTLKATDGSALRDWLSTNGFAAPASTESWIGRYVKLGFFFVALKFDGKTSAEAGTLVSETLRLSFDTAQPYYPYLEPAHDAPSTGSRVLRAWTVSTNASRPVTSVSHRDGSVDFTTPWSEGMRHDGNELRAALPTEISRLLPRGDLSVQTWRDFHRSRDGFGDIVFVPTQALTLDSAARERRRSLLPVIDPSLLEGETAVTTQ